MQTHNDSDAAGETKNTQDLAKMLLQVFELATERAAVPAKRLFTTNTKKLAAGGEANSSQGTETGGAERLHKSGSVGGGEGRTEDSSSGGGGCSTHTARGRISKPQGEDVHIKSPESPMHIKSPESSFDYHQTAEG